MEDDEVKEEGCTCKRKWFGSYHPCPYLVEMDGDEKSSFCNCCEYCTNQCGMDI